MNFIICTLHLVTLGLKQMGCDRQNMAPIKGTYILIRDPCFNDLFIHGSWY